MSGAEEDRFEVGCGSDDSYDINEEDIAEFENEDFDSPAQGSASRQNTRRKAAPGKSFTCQECQKAYNSLDTYKKHLKMHLVQDIFSTTPAKLVIRDQCRVPARVILEEMQSSRITSGLGGETKTIATSLCSAEDDNLWEFVDEVTNCILDSVPEFSSVASVHNFNTKYVESIATNLHTSTNRDVLVNALKLLLKFECSDDACKWFITRFCDLLAVSAEAFVLNFVKEPLEVVCIDYDHVDNRDNPDDLDFKQTVYYIGGSCIRSIFRRGRNKKGERWTRVIDCVKSKLLAGELVGKPDDDIVAWTDSMDRGGLQFINENVWNFLMVLSRLLKRTELPDGTINIEQVHENVAKDEVMMILWYDIVGDALNEEDCHFLLQNLCSFYINAWGKGVERRHLNAIEGRAAKGQVALRSALAK